MTTTPSPAAGELRLALKEIGVRENGRERNEAHVEALAQSIALRGFLVPLIVRPVAEGYELVAGYHRFAACRELKLADGDTCRSCNHRERLKALPAAIFEWAG